MYRCFLIALLFFFSVSALHAQQRKRVRWNAPPEEWFWVDDQPVAGATHHTLHSEAMNRDVGYNIYLPPSYETDKQRRFPVVYFFHGASGSERSDADPSMIRRLIREGKIGEVIYVYPNGGHFSRYRDWSDPRANVKSETFIIKELIPHIDASYRTLATRQGRALSGWSMGGDASLRFAFKYPEMFCAAGTFSAAIDWGAEGDDCIFAYSRKHVEQIRDRIGIYMVVGEDDRLFAPHKRLVPHLKQLKIDHTFESVPKVGHNLGLMKQHKAEAVALWLDEQLEN